MKNLITLLIFVFVIQSCENKTNKATENEPQQTVKSDKIHPSKYDEPIENEEIILGEDMEEINAYAKNIYEKNGIIYVDLDFVEIKYKNIDERVIGNKNPKLRTYIIDLYTLIATKDCKELTALDILDYKDILLKDKSAIVIGESKDGKMLSINFGCYG